MSEKKVPLATLGTREEAKLIQVTVSVTDTANTVHTEAVTFDKEYVNAPDVISAVCITDGGQKGTPSVDTVETDGMNVNLYQHDSGDLATGDYVVNVLIVGWKKS